MSIKQPTIDSSNDSKAAFSILIVDDESEICNFLSRALCKYYSVVDVAHNTAQAEVLTKQRIYDLLIVDINMPGQSGIDWLADSQLEINNSAAILMTGFADLEHAVAAVRLGVVDFILKPFRLEQMLKAVERSYRSLCLSRENNAYKHRLARQDDCSSIIGSSKLMKGVNQLIARVAATKSSVLIEGETGTGKELVANAIHDLSGRKGAFVAINCAAIAAELIESELFGHVKGAFTHASAREGLFSYADGGTLFLDEISEMPMTLQSKLLRVLEEGKIRPVGSNKEKTIDVRIVTACNKPLAPLIEKQLFREDLYYRLNILPITLPGLRERPEDIQPLSAHFLKQLADDLSLPAISIDRDDLDLMQCYAWPGNVRELRNLLERAMLLDSSPKHLLKDLVAAQQPVVNASYPISWTLHKVQLEHIEKVLESCQNNKSQAASVLGITRKTLDRKRAHQENCVAFK